MPLHNLSLSLYTQSQGSGFARGRSAMLPLHPSHFTQINNDVNVKKKKKKGVLGKNSTGDGNQPGSINVSSTATSCFK